MNLSDWVVVFDLDDTLISEREYERSGISAVEKCVSSLYGSPFEGRIQRARDAGIQDLWTWTCEQLDLPLEVKKAYFGSTDFIIQGLACRISLGS